MVRVTFLNSSTYFLLTCERVFHAMSIVPIIPFLCLLGDSTQCKYSFAIQFHHFHSLLHMYLVSCSLLILYIINRSNLFLCDIYGTPVVSYALFTLYAFNKIFYGNKFVIKSIQILSIFAMYISSFFVGNLFIYLSIAMLTI